MSPRYFDTIDTPIGCLTVTVNDNGELTHIGFEGTASQGRHNPARCRHVIDQLGAYFDGHRKSFDLALAPEGTPFQKRVWNALNDIPYGDTLSYSELAKRVDNPKGSRAVGSANGANPIPVVIPCHRVIAADGTLGGYAGGLHLKRYLLDLEGALENDLFQGPASSATVASVAEASSA